MTRRCLRALPIEEHFGPLGPSEGGLNIPFSYGHRFLRDTRAASDIILSMEGLGTGLRVGSMVNPDIIRVRGRCKWLCQK